MYADLLGGADHLRLRAADAWLVMAVGLCVADHIIAQADGVLLERAADLPRHLLDVPGVVVDEGEGRPGGGFSEEDGERAVGDGLEEPIE